MKVLKQLKELLKAGIQEYRLENEVLRHARAIGANATIEYHNFEPNLLEQRVAQSSSDKRGNSLYEKFLGVFCGEGMVHYGWNGTVIDTIKFLRKEGLKYTPTHLVSYNKIYMHPGLRFEIIIYRMKNIPEVIKNET